MGPGQLHPNEDERAILHSFATVLPFLRSHRDSLRVLSREFTGVGSFKRFQHDNVKPAESEPQLGLNHAEIHIPSVPSGLGAVLFCRDDCPSCLELFAYGDEHWDGDYEGF